ncbi:MAG: DNA (cytosine-5-)-methyltransferase [Caldisericia bacterium]|nr:DNA (cytosine-5-)-methyltransferase [Caldisericia bacterium]
MQKKDLTIGEVSKILNVSEDTIRRWAKKGLIKSIRGSNNYRLFNLEEVDRVKNRSQSNSSIKKGFYILKSKERTKYTIIDLFSGAGGTSLGFENAGLQHSMLVEYDRYAVETLKINRPNWNIVHKDIRDVDFNGLSADIVEGGFPCQAFSYAGKKLGFADVRGTMFFEFARCVDEVHPKIAIAENVKGLLRHDKGRTLQTMISILEKLGYRVKYKVLKSQYYDVAQKRERLIIIGVRKDLNIPILFPKENDYLITLREALKDVPKSEGQNYSDKKKKIMQMIPEGGYWKDLPEGLQKEYMGASYYHTGGRTGIARRLSWDEPSLTLTTSPAQKQTERCHPTETRPLSVREYARIQSFPDDWFFAGSVNQQYKQIGNALPVNLAYHIGRTLIAMLDQEKSESLIKNPLEGFSETKGQLSYL